MGPFQHPFQAHDHSTDLAHPAAPAGGCGPGVSRVPSPTCGSASVMSLPHTGSPAGRHLDWYGALDAIDFPARVAAVHRAIIGASAYLPNALLDATGHELHQIVAGILPGLLMLMAVLAATTVIGAAAGAAIGALAFGVGAAPGAAVGAGLGFEAGIAILNFLGIAFLAAYIGQSLVKATKLAAHAVSLAWQSVDRPEGHRRAVVDEASKTLAAAVAELMRGVLQGIVAFLLAKGTAAAASRVPGLVAKLRSSKLGATFAEWVERNWAELVNNPKLKEEVPPALSSEPATASAGAAKPNPPPQKPVASEPKPAIQLNPPIKITPKGMTHVVERHTVNGNPKFAAKSKFNQGEDLSKLITEGTQQPMVQQPNGNFSRTYDVGRDIGIDRATGTATSEMTVITRPNGELVTAFPGSP